MQFNVFCSSPNNYHAVLSFKAAVLVSGNIYLSPKKHFATSVASMQTKLVLHTCNCKSCAATGEPLLQLLAQQPLQKSKDICVCRWSGSVLDYFLSCRSPCLSFLGLWPVLWHVSIVCFPEEPVTSALVYFVYLIFILSVTTSCWCCQHTWWFIIQSRQASKVFWKGGSKFINTTSDCSDGRGSSILCRLRLESVTV